MKLPIIPTRLILSLLALSILGLLFEDDVRVDGFTFAPLSRAIIRPMRQLNVSAGSKTPTPINVEPTKPLFAHPYDFIHRQTPLPSSHFAPHPHSPPTHPTGRIRRRLLRKVRERDPRKVNRVLQILPPPPPLLLPLLPAQQFRDKHPLLPPPLPHHHRLQHPPQRFLLLHSTQRLPSRPLRSPPPSLHRLLLRAPTPTR